MENYYINDGRLFWQTRQLNQRQIQYFFFVKRLSKRRDLNQRPLDLQSDALSTELSGLDRDLCQSIEIYVSKEKIQR